MRPRRAIARPVAHVRDLLLRVAIARVAVARRPVAALDDVGVQADRAAERLAAPRAVGALARLARLAAPGRSRYLDLALVALAVAVPPCVGAACAAAPGAVCEAAVGWAADGEVITALEAT